MCSYPVEAQKVQAVKRLVDEEEEETPPKQVGRSKKKSKAVVPKQETVRPVKIPEHSRLLFDRNMAAGVDFLLRAEEKEQKTSVTKHSQVNDDPDQDILTLQYQEQQETETKPSNSNSTSTWIEQRFLESHDDALEPVFERRKLSAWKRKVQIDDGEDLLEITDPGSSDQAQSMVLGLRPEVTGALHEDRMHEHFLDTKNAVGAQNKNFATRLAVRALERWNVELNSNRKQNQVIEADLDGVHFRRVIAHSGFGQKQTRLRMDRRVENATEQELAYHAERAKAWEAGKKKFKRSLPKEEYGRLSLRASVSRRVLRLHMANEKGASKRSLKVPKFKKRMEKSFRPWVPDSHDTVERSQCGKGGVTFIDVFAVCFRLIS